MTLLLDCQLNDTSIAWLLSDVCYALKYMYAVATKRICQDMDINARHCINSSLDKEYAILQMVATISASYLSLINTFT